jgi:8-oxo-dGTP diphosphatase
MGVRNASSSRTAPSAGPVSIDVALISHRDRHLWVLGEATDTPPRRTVSLPWGTPARREHLDEAAARIARRATGFKPAWIEQAGAFGDGTRHPGGATLSVCYVAVVPWFEPSRTVAWMDTQVLTGLAERHRRMVSAALGVMRLRLEQAPIAFSMLPREFTLSELQQAYETILTRRLHKASFRRSLQAAFLVEPAGEWRGEGRGRPAQLYRFAPRRRKSGRRGVRLDLL